ncbi:MAG: TraB/GumN family protein [Saccharospirillaceae bacterium]|nr:TraB/GumN family protein [Pseudomonadales bacterium]NRB78337.1 TraB/GumN family protein [Saccharospirillaceae bacterium]
MKKRISLLSSTIVLALTTLLANYALAETNQQQTSVWKVSKTIKGKEQVVFFGGTIHLLRASDYPLPKQFDIAYQQADELFFEVDLEEATSQSAQIKMMQGLMLKNGETIQDKISKENYDTLESYLTKVGMPIEQMKLFTPEGLSLILSSQAIVALGFTPQGVDQFYNDLAKKDGKKLGFLETLDEQIAFITNMQADANKIMQYTFRDIDNLKNIMDGMVKSWREGTQIKAIVEEMKNDFPQIYQSLIVTRNNNWIDLLELQFLDDETEFVLVGVGHLTGEDSVLSILEAKGYLVEQL